MHEPFLSDPGEFARNDLRVDGIGDAQRRVPGDESEVAHVLDIAGSESALVAAAEKRLDHAPHPVLLELVGQLIEVGLSRGDQPLLRGVDVILRDRVLPVTPDIVREAGRISEGVHEPGLALGPSPYRLQRLRCEPLPRLLGVLRQQRQHVLSGQIAQTHRSGLDVECAASQDDGVFRTRVDTVVAHVAHAAQHHALRKTLRAPDVAGPELAQHGDQRVAHQGIDLVNQEHERRPVGLGPAAQYLAQRAVRAEFVKESGPDLAGQRISQRQTRPGSQLPENRPHRAGRVLPCRLAHLHVEVDAAILPHLAAVQQVPQREQDGGLARLPRRMKDEVALVAHEFADAVQIHPRQGRNAVVVRRDDGTAGIEEAHRFSIACSSMS